MLTILIPDICKSEQVYALDILLNGFLGLPFEVKTYNEDTIKITKTGSSKTLTIDATCFFLMDKFWLRRESLPNLPLMTWTFKNEEVVSSLIKPEIPILYGAPDFKKDEDNIHLFLDVFGSAFFMLSRYEELVIADRDDHDRFPAWASVAYKAHFLERPIIDEYVEILWYFLYSLWPGLERQVREPKNFITCDVDWPFDPSLYSLRAMFKKVAVQIVREKKFYSAIKTGISFIRGKLGLSIRDGYRDSISMIMDMNEQVGNRVAFYFITHNTSYLDSTENFDSQEIRSLFQEIFTRGHEIGLHPGYETYDNAENFTKTVDELRRILKEERIEQNQLGGRQHFLRWDSSKTPHLWEANGLDYDSTLSFADKLGFRCGTSHEFTMYDLVNRCAFNLKQRPLIVMECTVIATRYEGLGYSDKTLDRFNDFKTKTQMYTGDFTLLWHNSHFENVKDKEIYKKIIE